MRTLARLAVPVLLVSGLLLPACSTNPTTGRRQFNALTRDSEIQMGAAAAPEMLQEFGGAVPDQQLQAYVVALGQQMAAVTEADNPALPWEFTLLNSDVINAFALPGGKVFLSRGLAVEMTNDAQLAAVIGHEIGHVTARHINDKYTRVYGVTALLAVAGLAAGQENASLVQLGEQVAGVALLSYDRKQEIEADELGMRYMSRIGYDPIGAVQVQEILKRAMGDNRPPEMLSTHPMPETRIDALNAAIAKYRANPPAQGFQTGEARFQSQFLARLKQLPAVPKPKQTRATPAAPMTGALLGPQERIELASGGVLGARAGRVGLAHPKTWCAHCATH